MASIHMHTPISKQVKVSPHCCIVFQCQLDHTPQGTVCVVLQSFCMILLRPYIVK